MNGIEPKLKSRKPALSYKRERLAESLCEEIGEIVNFELSDERICSVLINGVKLSPDSHHARVYVQIDDKTVDADNVIKALEHAALYVRRQVQLQLGLRRSPQLHFIHDTTFDSSLHVD